MSYIKIIRKYLKNIKYIQCLVIILYINIINTENSLYLSNQYSKQRKMSWVIRCPVHGNVVTEYRSDGMAQLEKHSKEKQFPDESCYLYEDLEA